MGGTVASRRLGGQNSSCGLKDGQPDPAPFGGRCDTADAGGYRLRALDAARKGKEGPAAHGAGRGTSSDKPGILRARSGDKSLYHYSPTRGRQSSGAREIRNRSG